MKEAIQKSCDYQQALLRYGRAELGVDRYMCVRHPSQVENISLLFNLFKRNSAIFHSGCKNSVILHDQASAVIQHSVSPVFHGLIRRFSNTPKRAGVKERGHYFFSVYLTFQTISRGFFQVTI